MKTRNDLTENIYMYRQALFQYCNFFFQSVYFIPKVSFGGLGKKKIKQIYSKPIKQV